MAWVTIDQDAINLDNFILITIVSLEIDGLFLLQGRGVDGNVYTFKEFNTEEEAMMYRSQLLPHQVYTMRCF